MCVLYVSFGSRVRPKMLSGLMSKLLCFVQAKSLSRYGWMYVLAALVLVCVDVIVMSSA